MALQALSWVEKAEPVQVLRDQQSKDGCKVYMDSYIGIKWIIFHARLDYFQKLLLGGRSNTKPTDHGTPKVHNR